MNMKFLTRPSVDIFLVINVRQFFHLKAYLFSLFYAASRSEWRHSNMIILIKNAQCKWITMLGKSKLLSYSQHFGRLYSNIYLRLEGF